MIREPMWRIELVFETVPTEEYVLDEKGVTQVKNNINDKTEDFLVFTDCTDETFMIKKTLIQRISIDKEV